MIIKKSIGIVLFRETNGKREYLVLRRKGGDRYWGFAKGTPEKEETVQETAIREVKEETSLEEIRIIEGYKEKYNYYFKEDNQEYDKTVIFFLGKVSDKQDGKVSKEHEELRWLNYEEALNLITHNNDKTLLIKAEEHLKN
jgi:8-oxo-dGTP pyrophosphatase MutT (NUDIX family)